MSAKKPVTQQLEFAGTPALRTTLPSGVWVSSVDLHRRTPGASFAAMIDAVTGGRSFSQKGNVQGRFETMVFPADNHQDMACRRADTWEQAQKDHADLVAEFLAKETEITATVRDLLFDARAEEKP